jgi:hypothetical protein
MDVYVVCIVKTALAWVWPVGSYTELHGVYTQRTRALLTVHAVDGDACALGRFARPSRDQPPAANHPVDLHGSPHDSRSRPIACPPSTRAHHAAERSVSASPISRNQRSSAERSCRCAQTDHRLTQRSPLHQACPQATAPAMLAARKQKQSHQAM